MSIQIVPVEKPQSPIVINSVNIVILRVDLGVSADIEAQLLREDGSVVEVKKLTLSQPDYANWGSDDQFVVDWVLTQLGISQKTE